jgi:hypothetical protein
LPDIANGTDLDTQIQAAVGAHAQWKFRLNAAIEQGTSDFVVGTVRKDDQCPFGKWLHYEIAAGLKAAGHYRAVKELHATFHLEAAKVLELAVSGKKEQAKAAMDLRSPFSETSFALTRAMKEWRLSKG